VLKVGRISRVLAAGERQLRWRGPVEVRVEVQGISEKLEVSPGLHAFWKLRRALNASPAAMGPPGWGM
jgi:hypothetical protein